MSQPKKTPNRKTQAPRIDYTVEGTVCGLISTHRSWQSALRSLRQFNRRQCINGGFHSDLKICANGVPMKCVAMRDFDGFDQWTSAGNGDAQVGGAR